jgi:hypothetical protein
MQTAFFAFLHARVPGQKASVAKRRKILFTVTNQSPSDSHFAGAGLASGSTAGNRDAEIDRFATANSIKRIRDSSLVLDAGKELLKRFSIDHDLARATFDTNSRDRRFPAPGAHRLTRLFVYFCCNHFLLMLDLSFELTTDGLPGFRLR